METKPFPREFSALTAKLTRAELQVVVRVLELTYGRGETTAWLEVPDIATADALASRGILAKDDAYVPRYRALPENWPGLPDLLLEARQEAAAGAGGISPTPDPLPNALNDHLAIVNELLGTAHPMGAFAVGMLTGLGLRDQPPRFPPRRVLEVAARCKSVYQALEVYRTVYEFTGAGNERSAHV